MAAVRLSPSLLTRLPAEVSGGELQRIAIVRALLVGPHLVFADEATSRLDLLTQEITVDCLLSELGDAALLIVTHDRALAAAVSDTLVEMVTDW